MFALPPIVAELIPAIAGLFVAAGGWFAAKRAHDIGQRDKSPTP